MQPIEISYQDLRWVHPAYVEKLKGREQVVRQALVEMDRHDTSVRWSCIDDGLGNCIFRLVATSGRNDCIVQVSPLDLTLEPKQFAQILAEGKRSCVSVSR